MIKKYFYSNYEIDYEIQNNIFDLDINKIVDMSCINKKNEQVYFPILNNGILCPSNQSNHFLIPTILAKRVLQNYEINVYDKVLECFKENCNGTGRFFEALSTNTFELKEKILVISFGDNNEGFGKIFAMGMQNVDYIHFDDIVSLSNYVDTPNYDTIYFYTNEYIESDAIDKFIQYNELNLNQNQIKIATIVNYSDNKNIQSLIEIKIDDKCIGKQNNTQIIKCFYPLYKSNIAQPVINNNAKQQDNVIETIMTLMSSSDFKQINKQIKILFICDEDCSYMPMLISEFMSGFDNYDIRISSMTKEDFDIQNKIYIPYKDELLYLYNIKDEPFEFMFYISTKSISYHSNIYKQLNRLDNIQCKFILQEMQ